MTRNVVSTWPAEWSLVAIIGNMMPRRDPTDGDDDNEDEDAKTSPTNRWSCANPTTSSRPGVRQLNKSVRAGEYTVRRWQQVGT